MRRVLAVSTTTHDPAVSTSVSMLAAVLRLAEAAYDVQLRVVNADKLHIVQNLSCYANGKKDCANPGSGPYRCWAHHESISNPARFGGVDQMPVIYDGLAWADTVIWATSTRWGSHSALMQKIIERMNTLENRAVSWGEAYPMTGKRCGVIVGGLHWKTDSVAKHLQEVFRWFNFSVPAAHGALTWQYTRDVNYEQPGTLQPFVEQWLASPLGQAHVQSFTAAMCAA